MESIEGSAFGSSLNMRIGTTNTASKNAFVFIVLCILWTSTQGCTACLVSSAATVGAGAADAGVTHFELGRVKRYEIARYEDVIEASRRATENLSLALIKEKLSALNKSRTSLFPISKLKTLVFSEHSRIIA